MSGRASLGLGQKGVYVGRRDSPIRLRIWASPVGTGGPGPGRMMMPGLANVDFDYSIPFTIALPLLLLANLSAGAFSEETIYTMHGVGLALLVISASLSCLCLANAQHPSAGPSPSCAVRHGT
jgi:hypothetical protein